ncbi:ABC transporter permease, partial [Candidatus Dependentiae bacterium]|nr:ABC transporter permease [Candidatus Dependentiae bacterium]
MSKKNAGLIFIIAFFLSIIFINLISMQDFFRIDLTRAKVYTLSKASVKIMKNLEDVMVVTAYFSDDIPMPYAGYARYVQDLLEEYRASSKGKLSFEFIDPSYEETSEDKAKKKQMERDIFGRLVREPTHIESELMMLGIEPVEIRMLEDDKQQTKRAYMGLVIRYQGKQEVISVVQDVSNLEKEMTLLMQKLIRKKQPVVALYNDVTYASLYKWKELASKSVSLKEIQDIERVEDWQDADALIVAGFSKNISANVLNKMDEFIKAKKGVALLFDRFSVNVQSFKTNPLSGFETLKSEWLLTYGIEIADALVADINCATLNVSEQRGGMLLNVPVRYPFIPEVQSLNQESTLTHGLSGILLPFTSSLQIKKVSEINATVLASSSKNSWIEMGDVDTNPHRDWQDAQVSPSGPHVLMAQISSDKNSWRFIVSGTS